MCISIVIFHSRVKQNLLWSWYFNVATLYWSTYKNHDLTFVSCRSISSVAGDVAACRLTLQGWAVSCPPRSSHVVRCQGADSCVVPLYSLSPSACLPPSSPLRPPGARPNTSSVNPTPDVHGIVGGKLPGHSILALKWNLSSACTRSQVTP